MNKNKISIILVFCLLFTFCFTSDCFVFKEKGQLMSKEKKMRKKRSGEKKEDDDDDDDEDEVDIFLFLRFDDEYIVIVIVATNVVIFGGLCTRTLIFTSSTYFTA